MSADTPTPTLMTTEELLALPDDGTDRDLIRGELREKEMTQRNPRHSESIMQIGYFLTSWLRGQARPRGKVVGGEASFRIRRDPDTTVGVDVAYLSPELAARTPRKARMFDGPPVLVVEVLSPSDRQQDIDEKLELYREAGVPVVWIADPVKTTITVFRAGRGPVLFNADQELTGDPELPGFRAPVAELFED